MLSAGPPEGGFVPKPPFHREHQDFLTNFKSLNKRWLLNSETTNFSIHFNMPPPPAPGLGGRLSEP